jgi:hypothetical protein
MRLILSQKLQHFAIFCVKCSQNRSAGPQADDSGFITNRITEIEDSDQAGTLVKKVVKRKKSDDKDLTDLRNLLSNAVVPPAPKKCKKGIKFENQGSYQAREKICGIYLSRGQCYVEPDCQIFLGPVYQNGGEYTKLPLHYQMAKTCIEWPIFQMAIECTNLFHFKALQNLLELGLLV